MLPFKKWMSEMSYIRKHFLVMTIMITGSCIIAFALMEMLGGVMESLASVGAALPLVTFFWIIDCRESITASSIGISMMISGLLTAWNREYPGHFWVPFLVVLASLMLLTFFRDMLREIKEDVEKSIQSKASYKPTLYWVDFIFYATPPVAGITVMGLMIGGSYWGFAFPAIGLAFSWCFVRFIEREERMIIRFGPDWMIKGYE